MPASLKRTPASKGWMMATPITPWDPARVVAPANSTKCSLCSGTTRDRKPLPAATRCGPWEMRAIRAGSQAGRLLLTGTGEGFSRTRLHLRAGMVLPSQLSLTRNSLDPDQATAGRQGPHLTTRLILRRLFADP